MLRIRLLQVLLFSLPALITAQEAPDVKLVAWSSEPCDNTYDPYRLQTRITSLDTTGTITSITVNFADNCCVKFKPLIQFNNNKLMLMPYEKYSGNYCACDCCFSIRYDIEGLKGKTPDVYFDNKQIVLSADHYKTSKPEYTMYKGEKTNRINKYGFSEGLWIEFYKNGAVRSRTKYPESTLYFDPKEEWSKGYYESGKLSYYNRKDTSESWYEDGVLQSQELKYTIGDTTFEKTFSLYDNRQLKEKHLERLYPAVFKSEFDSTAKQTGSRWEDIYKEEYYPSGQKKYLKTNDTSYSWYENGQIKRKIYSGGEMQYNETGRMTQRVFCWEEPGVKGWRDLNNTLRVEYYADGNIKEITLSRDQKTENGIAIGVFYFWRWDPACNLTASPKNWTEAFPWLKFKAIELPPEKYKLH